jgi:hypothetical protein
MLKTVLVAKNIKVETHKIINALSKWPSKDDALVFARVTSQLQKKINIVLQI